MALELYVLVVVRIHGSSSSRRSSRSFSTFSFRSASLRNGGVSARPEVYIRNSLWFSADPSFMEYLEILEDFARRIVVESRDRS